MVRQSRFPSPTWRAFLRNHIDGIAALDTFVVASVAFRLLYVVIVLGHARRQIIHFAVTQHPTQDWLSRQITEAFPWDTAPRYLLRDRDASYGSRFRKRVEATGIDEVVTARRSPWQNSYAERVIGSIRHECLNHIIVFNERHRRRVLSSYVDYYHRSRTHLALDKDCPHEPPIQPPSVGNAAPRRGLMLAASASRKSSLGRSRPSYWSRKSPIAVGNRPVTRLNAFAQIVQDRVFVQMYFATGTAELMAHEAMSVSAGKAG